MAEDIVLEVLCLGCGRKVLPADINWLLFRNGGLAVHNSKRCMDKAYNRLYTSTQPKPARSHKKKVEVTTPQT
jgi:hypothetical protein